MPLIQSWSVPDSFLDSFLPKLTLDNLARSGHINRWYCVRTSRDQTLAEHHYMVTMISNRLEKETFGSDLDEKGIIILCVL
jgi:5'-deoxynucleotidase